VDRYFYKKFYKHNHLKHLKILYQLTMILNILIGCMCKVILG